MLFVSLTRTLTRMSALTAALLLAAALPARAEVIVSSLNNTSYFILFGIGGWAASPFTTDARAWTMTSAQVTLELGAQDISVANVRLLSDNAGQPGNTLADLGTVNVTNLSRLYTFSAPANVTLSPSNTYWIAVGNVGTNGGLNVQVSQGGVFTNTGVPGASMAYVMAGGAGIANPTNWFAPSPGAAVLFAVEGVPPGPGPDTNSPTLTILPAGSQQVYVAWPTNFTGYTLESSTNLLSAGAWTAFTSNPIVLSNRFAHLVDSTTARQFYRLRRP